MFADTGKRKPADHFSRCRWAAGPGLQVYHDDQATYHKGFLPITECSLTLQQEPSQAGRLASLRGPCALELAAFQAFMACNGRTPLAI